MSKRFLITFFSLTLVFLVFEQDVQAQQILSGIDVATVNVDQLSDDQIVQINDRIQSENFTINEAIEIAKIQGLPEAEAAKLQMRLMQLRANGSSAENFQIIQPLSNDEVEEIPSEESISTQALDSIDSESAVVFTNEIYGHSIFTDQSLDVFTTTDAARAPDWYVLGTGDQIRVTIFGVSQSDLLLEISEDGYVQPSGGQRIFLKGLTISEARTILQTRLRELYTFNEDEFAVTIKAARTITINIFGETLSKGGFTISALNTAFNALTVAGGPTGIGSVRNIQLIRGDERTNIDVYEFLTDPTVQTSYTLRHNDIIFVPIAENIVEITGSVKRPMRYELKDDDDLKDLINFAGGVTFFTANDFVQIQRIVNNEPILLEYQLNDVLEGNEVVALQDGDVVRVRPIGRQLEKFVTIEGDVFYPGSYDITKSNTLFKLLDEAQLRPEAMTSKIFLERSRNDNAVDIIPISLDSLMRVNQDFELQNEDNIIIYSEERYRTVANIEVVGQVRDPFNRSLEFEERLKISDAINLAGGLLPTASNTAFIFRTDIFNPDIVEHIRIDLSAIGDELLQPGDQLRVYNLQDYTDFGDLRIQGAVTSNFSTTYDSSLTISDLIYMAQGLSRAAALDNIEVFRLDISLDRGTTYEIIKLAIDKDYQLLPGSEEFELQPFDRIIVRRIPEYDFNATIEINGEVRYPGIYPIDGQRLQLTDVIRLAGGLTSSADPLNAIVVRSSGNIGPIGIDLANALKNENDPTVLNPTILQNDVIIIPEFQNIVRLRINGTRYGDLMEEGLVSNTGAISNNAQNNSIINTVFEGRKSAKWYIENVTGGFGREADKWTLTVTNPNGKVSGTKRRFLFFKKYPKVQPGSIITLRNKEEKLPSERRRIDINEVTSQTLQTATTILTLIILADRIQQ